MFRGALKTTRVHLEQTPIRPHWHLHISPTGLSLAGIPAGGIGTVPGNVVIDQGRPCCLVGLGQMQLKPLIAYRSNFADASKS